MHDGEREEGGEEVWRGVKVGGGSPQTSTAPATKSPSLEVDSLLQCLHNMLRYIESEGFDIGLVLRNNRPGLQEAACQGLGAKATQLR